MSQATVQVTHSCNWIQVAEGRKLERGQQQETRCVIITFGDDAINEKISFALGKQDVVSLIENLQRMVLQS